MSTRNYGQACSVARFLDRLGNRWTLLIIRDLLVGPRRFKELLANSPSMGPNLLTDRLRDLLDEGIVEKTPSGGAYALTEKGHALEPVVLAMARWGLDHLDVDPDDLGTSRPDLLVVVFRAAFQPERATGIAETYEFHVDDVVFSAEIENNALTTQLGGASNPAFVLTTDSETFDQIGAGLSDIHKEQQSGGLKVEGSLEAFNRFVHLFGGE